MNVYSYIALQQEVAITKLLTFCLVYIDVSGGHPVMAFLAYYLQWLSGCGSVECH